MPRDIAPDDIADLVARAEQVKRNREIILRTAPPKPLPTHAAESVALSADCRPTVYLQAGDAVATET